MIDLTRKYLEKRGPTLAESSVANWTFMTNKIAEYDLANMPPADVRQKHMFAFAEDFKQNQQLVARKAKDIDERYGEVYANRACQFVKIVFSWGVARGEGGLDLNPLAGMREPFAEDSDRSALTEPQLRILIPLIQGLDLLYRVYFMLLLLTGARSGETRKARWEHFNFTDRKWTKPKGTTKKNREHVVPLTDEMVSMLQMLKFRTGSSEWVFPSPNNDGKHIARPSHQTNNLVKELDGWVPHEFRNTTITGLEALGYSEAIVAACVGHRRSSQTSRYSDHEYLAQRREAFEMWGKLLMKIVAGNGSFEQGEEFRKRLLA